MYHNFFIHSSNSGLLGFFHVLVIIDSAAMNTGISSVQSLSHVQLCDPMDYSMPDSPVLHYLPKFAQTHVHQVGDAIQPSQPLSLTSPPAFNLSQQQ